MVVHPPSGASRHLPPQGRAIAYGISNTWAQLAEKFSNRNRLRTAIFDSGEAGRRNNGIELLASSIRFFICDSPALVGRVRVGGPSITLMRERKFRAVIILHKFAAS